MRVTDRMFHESSLRSLLERRDAYLTGQEQALTGSRVLRISDDPVAAARVRNLQSDKRQADDHTHAIDHAQTYLDRTDGALAELNGLLQKAREVAVQGMNDSLSADDRIALSHEVTAMADHVFALANTKVGGRYIFSGFADDTPAVDAAGTYQGTADVPEVEIGPGIRVPLGVAGDQVFTGGADAIAVVQDLQAALASNDTEAVGAALTGVINAELSLTDQWGRVGAFEERVQVARSVADTRLIHAQEGINAQMAIDPLESYSSLSRARGALEAAVQIAAQLPPPGLVGR